MATLEQLRTQVSETKNKLENSRALSPEERLVRATELETTISQIKKDLDSLKLSAKQEDLLEIEAVELEYKKLQEQLTVFKKELDDFQNQLKEDISQDIKQDEDTDYKQKKENKKNWFGRQIEGLTSKDEWSSNPAKNVARIAGGFGAVWLGSKIIKGIGRLFKKKNNNGSETKSTEKKPWYKKWWGIGLIGAAGFLGIRWFMTGKNPIDRGGPGLSSDPEKQLSIYIEFGKKSPEEFKKYQNIGENTNFIYSKIYDKEINSGWYDADSLGKIGLDCVNDVKDADPNLVYSGLVPYIMDKNFSSVGKIISPEGLKYQEWSSDIDYLKTKILGWGKQGISNILGPFLGSLQSWIGLGNKSGESIEDKFSRWAESGNKEDRLKELQFFFRQYMKVNTYLICKKDEIMISIAKEKYGVSPDGFSSFEDAMENKDWFKKNIEKDKRYSDFMSGKLTDISTNIESAGVSLNSLSDEIMEQVDELDEVRDKILHSDGEGDILDAGENDIKSGGLSSGNITKLNESCDLMLDDIKNEVEDTVKESCWDPYSYLFNTAGINKETFIENSGLEELFGGLKSAIISYQTKINSGSITSQEYAEFKNLTNQYFAMKKEMVIGSQTLQSINEGGVGRRVAGFLWGCLGNLGKSIENFIEGDFGDGFKYLLTGIAPFIVIREGYLCFARKGHGIKRLKQVGNITFGAPKKIIQSNFWIAKQISGKYVGSPRVLRSTFFRGADGPDKLWKALSNVDRGTLVRGKISLDKAVEIIENGKNSNLIDPKIKAKWGAEFPQSNKNLIKRGIVQKIIPGVQIDQLDIMVKYYDNKTLGYLIRNGDNSNIIKLRNFDDQIKILSKGKQDFILESLNKRVLDFDQVDDLLRNIDNIDITKISPNKLANGLAKGNNVSSVVDDLMKNSSKINNIDAATKTKFNSIIDEAIVSVRSQSSLNANFSKINEAKLSTLKNNKHLTELDMKSLVTLHGKGFRGSSLPDLFDVLKSDISYNKGTGKLGQYLQDALNAGDYDSFIRALGDHKNSITKIDIDDIIKQMDNVKLALKNVDEFADILKGISRIIKLI